MLTHSFHSEYVIARCYQILVISVSYRLKLNNHTNIVCIWLYSPLTVKGVKYRNHAIQRYKVSITLLDK